MMHPQPGPGPYGMPPGSATNPPVQKMAGMALGPHGYPPPSEQDNTHYNPPPGGMGGAPPQMDGGGSFPQRSSSYTQQQQPPKVQPVGGSNIPGQHGGNFPQHPSQYSQPPPSGSAGQAHIPGSNPIPNQPSGMGMGPPFSQGPPASRAPSNPQMMHPGSQPFQPPGPNARGVPPLSSSTVGGGGQPFQGFTNGLSSGPPGGPPSGPPRTSNGPPMNQPGPPGMSMGPPMNQPGPPGMSMGPPMNQPGPPGMSMGPPTNQPGPPGMSMGPPTNQPGPPGMSMNQPGPPGMSMNQPGPPGMSMGRPGMSLGPPTNQPGPPGMSMGPPTNQPGPPGMSMNQPGPPGISMGPPTNQPGPPGMSMGPPTNQPGPPGMSMNQPGPPGMSMNQPRGTGMSMGPPGMSMNQPGPPSMSNGPPGMAMGPGGGGGGQFARPPGPPMAMGPGGGGGGGGGPPGGPIQQQPKSRIDPDHMPNPVEVMKADQEQHKASPYRTTTQGVPPPLVTTAFTVQDDGNASPRYMRSTLYTIPCSKDLLNGCKIPMGLVIQAFARIPQNENTLHLVDHGAGGPIRCNRCKAYMNPYARFIDGGRRYLCPICQCSNEVPPEYFCHLDHQGQRTDAMQRPELCYGSVEYVATKDYCKEGNLPLSPAYIFMIDVSYVNNQSGLVDLLSHTILGLLDNLPGSSEGGSSPIKVGFVTYDRVLHFYNVKANMAQPQMMVMTDVDDVFVPMVDGFLVDIAEARTLLESLMSQLPSMFSDNKAPQVVLEPVVHAGMEALKAAGRNGRIFVFHSSLPTAQATGLLKNRMDSKLLGTDKEKNLLNAASSPYKKLAEDCVKYGVGVELFVFPSTYCDVATLGSFAASTGGELHYYKNYVTSRDGDRLIEDLRHSISRPTGFDCVMRVRSSTGLRPTGFYGAFYMNNTTDIELGNIDCDKAIAVEIKHDDKLREDENAFFQAALLYTDYCGTRRLRVHNLSLGCSTKFPDIYRSCEIDTITNFLSKSILHASLSMSYKSIRENLTHQCAVILSCYRKQCSSHSPPGQLILPESLKLLPMYANCLLKSDAILSPPIVSLDEKCWLMMSLLSMPTTLAGSFIYPRMFSLHDLDVNEKGMPPLMRCTGQKLQESGLYVLENGLVMVIWIGQQLGADSIQSVFGAPSLAQINTEMHVLPALDNPLSYRVRDVLELIQSQRQRSMKLIVTKQKDRSEITFRRLLKEDKGAGQWEGINYIEFLCQVHREIKEILS